MYDEISAARTLARNAHAGQKYGTQDYFTAHLSPVVSLLSSQQHEDYILAAAWLHDVVEDTAETGMSLFERGFSARIVRLVMLLTRHPEDSYGAYIQRVSEDYDATTIKLADLIVNLRTVSPGSDLERRYQRAKDALIKNKHEKHLALCTPTEAHHG